MSVDLEKLQALEMRARETNHRLAELTEKHERSFPDLFPYREPAGGVNVKQATMRRTRLFGWHLANTNAAAVFLHFYDSESLAALEESAPATDIKPFFTLEAPIGVLERALPHPILFRSGIAYAVSGAFGGQSGDTSAPSGPLSFDLFVA